MACDFINHHFQHSQLLFLLFLGLISAVVCSPWNRYAPGESYGHTGENPPPKNPNGAYGYDRHGLMGDNTGYGARFNRYRDNRSNSIGGSDVGYTKGSYTVDFGTQSKGSQATVYNRKESIRSNFTNNH